MAQKKMGRPPLENPMKDRIIVRVDNETKAKLEACMNTLGITRSEIVRKGIDTVYDGIKK